MKLVSDRLAATRDATAVDPIRFLLELVLFALDEASDLGVDEAAKLLDQVAIMIAAHPAPRNIVALHQAA
jgi:hypothetical protein